MKLTLTFSLDDIQLQTLDNVFNQHDTATKATSKDVSRFVGTCIKKALSLRDVDVSGPVAEAIIKDINNGGWTLIGQPETKPL